ncbi:MAG: hypothetical protein ABIT83_05125 [Massilia sp.]
MEYIFTLKYLAREMLEARAAAVGEHVGGAVARWQPRRLLHMQR